MTMPTSRLLIAAIAIATAGTATPALAAGCNGVVDIFKWGCAPWDNNGPKYPYFKKTIVTRNAPRGSPIQIKDGAAMVQINGQWYPVADGAAGVVAAAGGNVVAAGGGNVIAAGGLNLQTVQGN